jgi:aminoglycoside phosphotransferase (APT) family kinase protein
VFEDWTERLAGYLAGELPGTGGGTGVAAEMLSGGRSSLTFLLRLGDRELILRCPPGPADGGSAHDISREYRVMRALNDTGVRVPRAVLSCTDPAVIGVPFYLVSRVHGRVVTTAASAPDLAEPARAKALGTALIDGLVSVHAVDPGQIGLGSLGRPDGYVRRQAERWANQWAERKQRDIPEFDELGRRLLAALDQGTVNVVPDRATLVHGDYNLSNVMVADAASFDRGPVLRAILDWEFATLGYPLMDLGLLLSYNGPYGHLLLECDPLVSSAESFPERDELIEMYATASGRDTSDMDFFYVLAFYRTLIINEDVRRRYLAGEADGREGFEHMGRTAPVIARHLLDFANQSAIAGLNGRR